MVLLKKTLTFISKPLSYKTMKPTTRKKLKKPAPKTRAPKKPAKTEELPPKTEEKTSETPKLLPLKPRQWRFVQEYVKDLNGKQAAIRAGYSARSAEGTAWDLLRYPHVKAAVAKRQREIGEKIGVSAESVVAELALIGFFDMADFVQVSPDGTIKLNLMDELKPGRSRIIKKIKEKKTVRRIPGTEGDLMETTLEYEMCEKVKSLELLARHLGILHDKTEVTGAEGGPISFTDLERATKLQRLIAMAKKRQNEPGSAKDSGNK